MLGWGTTDPIITPFIVCSLERTWQIRSTGGDTSQVSSDKFSTPVSWWSWCSGVLFPFFIQIFCNKVNIFQTNSVHCDSHDGQRITADIKHRRSGVHSREDFPCQRLDVCLADSPAGPCCQHPPVLHPPHGCRDVAILQDVCLRLRKKICTERWGNPGDDLHLTILN